MDELWVRLGLIAASLAVAGAAAALVRARAARGPRILRSTDLATGIYLLTAASCPDCAVAKDALNEALGPDGFVEMEWETAPGVFDALDVDEVPTTLIVAEDGTARLWAGSPANAIAFLGP